MEIKYSWLYMLSGADGFFQVRAIFSATSGRLAYLVHGLCAVMLAQEIVLGSLATIKLIWANCLAGSLRALSLF